MIKDIVTVYKATFRDPKSQEIRPFYKILISETKGDTIRVDSYSTSVEIYESFLSGSLPLKDIEVDYQVSKFGDKTTVKVVSIRQ